MSDQTPDAAGTEGLQFNEAEYAGPETGEPATGEPACVACHQAIPDQYFQVNGVILCEHCSTTVKARLIGGSSFPRFVKACVYGFGAAIAGFAIYFGVLKLTGMEVGLISILVGYMVGAAVNKGSEGRGGALYQLTAVFLTYLAIAVSYSALMLPQMFAQAKADKAAAAQPKDAAGAEVPEAAVDQPADQPAEEPARQKPLTPAEFAIGLASLFAFMLALPILAGFQQPIGLAIVAFALWEAYKLNRKANIEITGPHNVGRTPERALGHV